MEFVKNNKIKNIFVNWKDRIFGILFVCLYVIVVDFFNFIKVVISFLDNFLGFIFDDYCV